MHTATDIHASSLYTPLRDLSRGAPEVLLRWCTPFARWDSIATGRQDLFFLFIFNFFFFFCAQMAQQLSCRKYIRKKETKLVCTRAFIGCMALRPRGNFSGLFDFRGRQSLSLIGNNYSPHRVKKCIGAYKTLAISIPRRIIDITYAQEHVYL